MENPEKKPKRVYPGQPLVRKIKVEIQGTKEEKKAVKAYIEKVIQQSAILSNRVAAHFHHAFIGIGDMEITEKLSRKDAMMRFEDEFGETIKGIGYRIIGKDDYEQNIVSSSIYDVINSAIYQKLFDNYRDYQLGKMSVPSFTQTKMAIPFKAHHMMANGTKPKAIKKELVKYKDDKGVEKEKEEIFVKFPLRRGIDVPDTWLKLVFGKDRSNNRIILERIINCEYKMCDSAFKINDKGELMLLLSYKQQSIIGNKPDPNIVMGLDLGIRRPISHYITNVPYQPRQLTIGEKIFHEKMRMDKLRAKGQSAAKFNRGGHGREKKLDIKVNFRNKERNWTENMNHEMSKAIIEVAKRNNVGIIKIEDLTGIKDNKRFLKKWTYFDLQQKIRYKAELNGIEVWDVNPYQTSITCPECGEVDNENRKGPIFKCLNPYCKEYDKEHDADIIGAMNISTKPNYERPGKKKKKKKATTTEG
jgi:IS605 OrfB family transposase